MTDYGNDNSKSTDREYKNAKILRRLHWDEEMCYREMAEELGCHKRTIRRWMNRLEVDRRSPKEGYRLSMKTNYATYSQNNNGHPMWVAQNPDTKKTQTFAVHRLLAVAEFGIEAVKGMDIHHKNGIPFDNRVDNLEVVSKGDHASIHKPWEESPIIP